jgi:hypothetical protein
MSTLTVKELAAPSGFDLKLASGETLDLKSQGTVTMPTGSVLQVVQSSVKTTADSTTSSTPNEISTSYRVTLTPRDASSKILLMFCGHINIDSSAHGAFGFYRDINGGGYSKVSAGICTEAFRNKGDDTRQQQATLIHYDAPSTTNQCIYTMYFWRNSGSGNVQVNDNGMGSFMLAMEVQG